MEKKVFEKGQALITLLFFTIMGITITSAAIVMILVNSLSGAKQQQGMIAYEVAQSGADNALIRVLRNPSYSGETLPVGTGQAVITVTGSGSAGDPYIIVSKGEQGIFYREIQVTATYQGNLLTVTQRKEIYS